MSEIKANLKDTRYVFIPLTKAQILSAREEFLLTYKDTGLTENTTETIKEILEALS